MSILIKGMKMPNNCQSCPFSDDECRYCKAALKYSPMLGKPKFCPLVEVPTPHGRLVNCETLRDDLAVLLERNKNLIYEWLAYAIDDVIDEVPTIIEAEEGEEA